MKVKHLILSGVAILGAIVAGWIFWLPKPIVKPAVAVSQKDQSAEQPVISSANEPNPKNTRATPPEEDGPIVFYGKLEDQAANPVPYASIVANKTYHDGGAELSETLFARSDADGFFKIEGGSGKSLEIMPHEAGYALASTNNVAFYGSSQGDDRRSTPDPNQPVIIKMWKLQGAEPLTRFDARYKMEPGSPVYFDFVTQTTVPSYVDFHTQQVVPSGGDLKITIHRSPGVVSEKNHPDWSVELETTQEGGLIEVTPEIWATTYWAPTGGYQPDYLLRVSGQPGRKWSPNIETRFFVQTRQGGVYTKLFLKAAINLNPSEPAEITLSGVANTNGSCNWEADADALKP